METLLFPLHLHFLSYKKGNMKTMDYLIGDTHFNHENIILYENRPFRNVEHMNQEIIKRWNNKVKKTDTIFLLGDVGMGSKDKLKEIINQLNGKKILIMGNHDGKSVSRWYDIGFNEVYKYPILYKDFFLFMHEPPTYFNEAMPYFFAYAHVHSTDMYKTITKNTACVSAERWNYTPVSIPTLVEMAKKA